jgi:torulene dioxygenase
MTILSKVLPVAVYGISAANALTENPGAHGPPPDSDPLSWGFYASPETPEATLLDVQGTIPEWVTGSLYRGSFSTWDAGNYTAEHWFDGFSRNHRFEIADGQVSYRSRNASEEMVEFIREVGLYPGPSFGGDPCKIIFGAFETTFRDGENAVGDSNSTSVQVAYIPNFAGLARNSTNTGAPFDTLVSTTDANQLQQIDPVTLEPIELLTYQALDPLLVNGGRSAAHPVLSDDGAIYNYILDLEAEPPTYRVFGIFPPEGETRILANITDAPPAYIHAVFGSEKHIVLIIWQADLKKQALNIVDSIGDWDPNRKALFYVIDRFDGGLLRKYEAPDTFFAFHEINTFENEAGDIFVDLPRMADATFLESARLENLRHNIGSPNSTSKNDLNGSFTRYRLPHPDACHRHSNGSVPTFDAEIDFSLPLAEANIELPRINPANYGKPYRYSYGIHTARVGTFADSIIKIDADAQEWSVWVPETRQLPSEPIFIARPGATREDDGVLVLVVMDAAIRSSALVFLDAQTMEEVGRAIMPVVVGYGFHGAWGSA